MNREEIRNVVHDVLAEERRVASEQMDVVVLKSVSAILTSFGMNDDDRKSIRADFEYLRRWRHTSEQVTRASVVGIVTLIISGLAGALWLGIKLALGK